MRQLAIVSLAALALVGCGSYDNQSVAPARTNPSTTLGTPPANPIDSVGRSDAATSGSASNAASGSTVTQHATPGAVR